MDDLELSDMGAPTPRIMPEYRYQLALFLMLAAGVLSPLVFIYVAWPDAMLFSVSMLNLVGTYSGLFLAIRGWRESARRRLYGGVALMVVCFSVTLWIF